MKICGLAPLSFLTNIGFGLVDMQKAYDIADRVFQKLKSISNTPQAKVEELLSNMWSLRSLVAACRKHVQGLENGSSMSMEALEAENNSLRASLVDANALLQRAHERLLRVPNSSKMCEQIVLEMNKMGKAMEASTRDISRLKRPPPGTKDKKFAK